MSVSTTGSDGGASGSTTTSTVTVGIEMSSSTTESGSGGGSDGITNGGGNGNSLSESTIIVIVLIVCISVVIIVIAVLILIYATQTRKERTRKQSKHLEMVGVTSNSVKGNNGDSDIDGGSTGDGAIRTGSLATGMGTGSIGTGEVARLNTDSSYRKDNLGGDGLQISNFKLPQQPQVKTVSTVGKGQGQRNTSSLLMDDHEEENSHNLEIDDLFTDLEGNYNENNDNNHTADGNGNGNGNVNGGAQQDELFMEGNSGNGDTNATNGRAPSLIANAPGAAPGGDGVGNKRKINTYNMGIDRSKYDTWSQKEVLIWLKMSLVENGIDNEIIKSFLKEFSRKYVTGAMLVRFQKDEKLLDSLQEQFSARNQAFGLWMVVKTALKGIDEFQE